MTQPSCSSFPGEDNLKSAVKVPQLTAAGLLIVAATYGLARYSFGLFLPEIRGEFALSSEMIGLIAGGSYLGYLAATFVGAWLSTVFGPKLPILLGGLAATVGMVLIALASTPLALACGVCVAGTSPGLAYPPFSDVIVRQINPHRQNTVYAWINSGTGFGVALAGPLALWASMDWRLTWLMFAIFALLVTLWNGWTIPFTQPMVDKKARSVVKLGSRLNRPVSYPLFVTSFIFGIVTSVYWTYAVDLLQSLTNDPQASVLFWIVLGIAGAFGCFAGRIVNKWGLRLSYKTLMVIVAVAIGTLPVLAATKLGIYFSASFFGLGFIVATAIFGMWAIRAFQDAPSIGFGTTFFLISLGQGLGPIIGGFVEPVISQTVLFNIAGIFCACLAFFAPASFQKSGTAA